MELMKRKLTLFLTLFLIVLFLLHFTDVYAQICYPLIKTSENTAKMQIQSNVHEFVLNNINVETSSIYYIHYINGAKVYEGLVANPPVCLSGPCNVVGTDCCVEFIGVNRDNNREVAKLRDTCNNTIELSVSQACLCEGKVGWFYDGVCEPGECELCPDCLRVEKIDDKTAKWGKENSGGIPTVLKLIDFDPNTEKVRFKRESSGKEIYDKWFSEKDCLVEGEVFCRVFIKDIIEYNSYVDIILVSPSTGDKINLRYYKSVTPSTVKCNPGNNGICEPTDCPDNGDCIAIKKIDERNARWGNTILTLTDVNPYQNKAKFKREPPGSVEWFDLNDCVVEGMVFCRVKIIDIYEKNNRYYVKLQSPGTGDVVTLSVAPLVRVDSQTVIWNNGKVDIKLTLKDVDIINNRALFVRQVGDNEPDEFWIEPFRCLIGYAECQVDLIELFSYGNTYYAVIKNMITETSFPLSIVKGAPKAEEVIITEPENNVCKDGCMLHGICVPINSRTVVEGLPKYCDLTGNWQIQKQQGEPCQNDYECISNNCKDGSCKPICDGCLDENKNCLPIGTRIRKQYCDVDKIMKNQKYEDSYCDNNYECQSNLCINNKCMSPSLWQRFLNWLKELFG
jgi:hypothetical protein